MLLSSSNFEVEKSSSLSSYSLRIDAVDAIKYYMSLANSCLTHIGVYSTYTFSLTINGFSVTILG